MFYHVSLSKTLDIHPRYFGPRLREVIEDILKQKEEGICIGNFGYVVCITGLKEIGEGLIRPDGTGFATFTVKYDCVLFRPFRGEVLDATVQQVITGGFIAEAGPLEIFVSIHCIPDDYTFHSGDAAFVSADESTRIQEGVDIRLRILSTRIDAAQIACVGTIKEDFLRVLES
ncbi:hypothetical protein BSKO_08366 [Bryopsis sp. KO-2023]|nr:hypothetical protein BSKO_08366 [Bryopsis sp. KO-2023]